ncbi:Lrp/AsnC family transcriptional regulator [Paraglaciecola chathamensis]|jgi:DNA-binding Lrp family transcriptional regulator|uniref:Leucine-responsive regulatory protein n=3 Tax=Paraglaciecola chathamensis TaxID=368405 RepID=A0A8H9I732_9ALTE|nr:MULTISPECIES: Lrp/AsnC family transcriptional regulator [Paraglaciecola]AEE21540.1 transcriptional regulator, AsnC family [Glaciecola sp. 4H-3-7+YE-5]MBN25133.1 Lrp/AsnC family transcriptional regulator [Alteromonadaceae bacterium]MBJ2135639.1 Lrp/AsnC family transcriptional regulator [Paraglaciecola chathamensis]MDO6559128.1 Lrp/AsnC family transcriptional regulator [Paraglaciecola chathamensis]MDO6840051.1 Lrp/AsnC family transcriptional regulator [Paraglaciecola chathamensis]|tara:strand:+ start:20785 stop:21237 length:453 start_codon:yes stop_codon:yes gene_type:complete
MNKKDLVTERILHELSIHGRISNTELAEKIGLSASACLRRVQELENSGVIKGYRAILDSELLGNGFIAYVTVGLGQHTKASQDAFEQAIADANEVKECHNVTGSFEYILRVETRNLKTYKTFHTDILGTLPQVSTITTHVVMDSPKDQRA